MDANKGYLVQHQGEGDSMGRRNLHEKYKSKGGNQKKTPGMGLITVGGLCGGLGGGRWMEKKGYRVVVYMDNVK